MNKTLNNKRQYGFADLGISLLVLAISGTVALATNHREDERIAAQQESMVIESQVGASADYRPMEMPRAGR